MNLFWNHTWVALRLGENEELLLSISARLAFEEALVLVGLHVRPAHRRRVFHLAMVVAGRDCLNWKVKHIFFLVKCANSKWFSFKNVCFIFYLFQSSLQSYKKNWNFKRQVNCKKKTLEYYYFSLNVLKIILLLTMNSSFFRTFTIWQDFKFLGRIFTSLDQKLTSVSVGRVVGAADGSFVVATAEVASRSGHSSRNWNYSFIQK